MTVAFRKAAASESDLILAYMQALYASEGLVFDRDTLYATLAPLLVDNPFGWVTVIVEDDAVIGYAVLTFGYSVEFHGRFVLLDELYLTPEKRGQGIGSLFLQHLGEESRALGLRAVLLEVVDGNDVARRFYLRHGFVLHERRTMTWQF